MDTRPQPPTPDHPVGPDNSGTDPTDAALVDPTLVDAALVDTVAGEPPVPITVWRTARTSTEHGRVIGARLAYRLVSAYSRAGDAVVDLTDGHALMAACRTGNRRHHPGWFTDVASLIVGPATDPANDADDHDTVEDVDPADLSVWFGDDLTDPRLAPTGPPGEPSEDGGSLHAATSLVVAMWPLDAGDVANRVRLAWLLTACARLLRSGGCLVLIVANPSGASAPPQDFAPIIAAAASVALGYLQHIAAVDADAGAEAFVYHVTDEELLGLVADTGDRWAVAHLRVHADLLVFSQVRPSASRRRDAGARRG